MAKVKTCPRCGQDIPDQNRIIVDMDGNRIIIDGEPINMTAGHVDVMEAIVAAWPRVATRAFIMERCYGGGGPDSDKIIDVEISQIRRHLEGTVASIETIWGKGYKLKLDA